MRLTASVNGHVLRDNVLFSATLNVGWMQAFLIPCFPFQMARDREDNDSAELSNKNFSTLKSMSGSGKIIRTVLRFFCDSSHVVMM